MDWSSGLALGRRSLSHKIASVFLCGLGGFSPVSGPLLFPQEEAREAVTPSDAQDGRWNWGF